VRFARHCVRTIYQYLRRSFHPKTIKTAPQVSSLFEVPPSTYAILRPMTAFLIQTLNGLASASALFLVAVGLSLTFGVTRVVNFAHASLYMIGTYVAVTIAQKVSGGLGFWGGAIVAACVVALIGALIETLLLKRIYDAPDLLQLTATFAVVLIIKDAALAIWGAEDILGPRAPGLKGAVDIFGKRVPEYDLFLIVIGPLVLLGLHALMTRTRFGVLVRAATEDREMTAALGVNQSRLFTLVFVLGAFLAGLGGALQIPREPANLNMDMAIIGEVFVVVVVGGMGSLTGAYLAAILISLAKAYCYAIGDVSLFGTTFAFSKFTLVVEFIIMAVVLSVRPHGLLGKPLAAPRITGLVETPLPSPKPFHYALLAAALGALALLPFFGDRYFTVLATDVVIFSLFAVSLHFMMGPGGMHSFGHAAYFGLGAYAAALALAKGSGMGAAIFIGMISAGLGAVVFGWLCVRLSGVYLAMLTLAFASIVWSIIFQWDHVTGGSNGLTGIWPPEMFNDKRNFYWLTLAICAAGIVLMWRMIYSSFGLTLRAARDAARRSEALGVHVKRVQWLAFVIAGLFAGLAGALFAFSKGSISPEVVATPRSVDALVMVLLGGIETLTGPILGAAIFTVLQDWLARSTEYWRAAMGALILLIVLVFPRGVMGSIKKLRART
jgi:branched-chain amino acid transport system permease protein